mgnify:CR=1 FL=1|tara:strand:+ start:899 stop:1066 length:168 start_codon:yes stop_codon:yes gene_type:complete
MIVLKKDNHYEHTTDADKASKMVQNGYKVVKGSSMLAKTKTAEKPKKKPSSKKKK